MAENLEGTAYEAIRILFATVNVNGEVVRQANQFLMDFSDKKECFFVSFNLITSANCSLVIKHFAANLLFGKIRKNWSQLTKEERQGLYEQFLQYLMSMLIPESFTNDYKVYEQLLARIAAAIVIRLTIVSENSNVGISMEAATVYWQQLTSTMEYFLSQQHLSRWILALSLCSFLGEEAEAINRRDRDKDGNNQGPLTQLLYRAVDLYLPQLLQHSLPAAIASSGQPPPLHLLGTLQTAMLSLWTACLSAGGTNLTTTVMSYHKQGSQQTLDLIKLLFLGLRGRVMHGPPPGPAPDPPPTGLIATAHTALRTALTVVREYPETSTTQEVRGYLLRLFLTHCQELLIVVGGRGGGQRGGDSEEQEEEMVRETLLSLLAIGSGELGRYDNNNDNNHANTAYAQTSRELLLMILRLLSLQRSYLLLSLDFWCEVDDWSPAPPSAELKQQLVAELFDLLLGHCLYPMVRGEEEDEEQQEELFTLRDSRLGLSELVEQALETCGVLAILQRCHLFLGGAGGAGGGDRGDRMRRQEVVLLLSYGMETIKKEVASTSSSTSSSTLVEQFLVQLGQGALADVLLLLSSSSAPPTAPPPPPPVVFEHLLYPASLARYLGSLTFLFLAHFKGSGQGQGQQREEAIEELYSQALSLCLRLALAPVLSSSPVSSSIMKKGQETGGEDRQTASSQQLPSSVGLTLVAAQSFRKLAIHLYSSTSSSSPVSAASPHRPVLVQLLSACLSFYQQQLLSLGGALRTGGAIAGGDLARLVDDAVFTVLEAGTRAVLATIHHHPPLPPSPLGNQEQLATGSQMLSCLLSPALQLLPSLLLLSLASPSSSSSSRSTPPRPSSPVLLSAQLLLLRSVCQVLRFCDSLPAELILALLSYNNSNGQHPSSLLSQLLEVATQVYTQLFNNNNNSNNNQNNDYYHPVVAQVYPLLTYLLTCVGAAGMTVLVPQIATMVREAVQRYNNGGGSGGSAVVVIAAIKACASLLDYARNQQQTTSSSSVAATAAGTAAIVSTSIQRELVDGITAHLSSLLLQQGATIDYEVYVVYLSPLLYDQQLLLVKSRLLAFDYLLLSQDRSNQGSNRSHIHLLEMLLRLLQLQQQQQAGNGGGGGGAEKDVLKACYLAISALFYPPPLPSSSTSSNGSNEEQQQQQRFLRVQSCLLQQLQPYLPSLLSLLCHHLTLPLLTASNSSTALTHQLAEAIASIIQGYVHYLHPPTLTAVADNNSSYSKQRLEESFIALFQSILITGGEGGATGGSGGLLASYPSIYEDGSLRASLSMVLVKTAIYYPRRVKPFLQDLMKIMAQQQTVDALAGYLDLLVG